MNLYQAANMGDVESVERLLKDGVDPNEMSDFANGPLHAAANTGSVELAKVLIDAGCNVNAINDDGVTPLMRAANHGRAAFCKTLVDNGADVTIANRDGLAASNYAKAIHHTDLEKALQAANDEALWQKALVEEQKKLEA